MEVDEKKVGGNRLHYTDQSTTVCHEDSRKEELSDNLG
jgi:hypothetical protein